MNKTTHILTALVLLTACFSIERLSAESLPEGSQLTKLEVFPQEVGIENRYRYRQLLVTGVLDSGDKIDVTRMVQAEAPDAVAVSKHGVVRPRTDGSGEIRLTLAGQSVAVPFKVSGYGDKPAMSFIRDIQPVLSRTGCNNGVCHGSQQGRNGFKLSLRGYDTEFDHRALTDDLSGRRFNRAAPDRSLFLMKPSGAVPHEGGVLFSPGDDYYEMLRSWIAAGVELDLDAPRVTSIKVFPRDPVLGLADQRQQAAVLATYSDGTVRDVTVEAFLESSNIEVTSIDEHGVITALRRGESAVLARYEGQYAVSRIFVMGDRKGFEWKAAPQLNYIDELVDAKLQRIKALPSPLCTDEEFVRRIHLDLTGLPPRVKDVRAFLIDTRPSRTKREELIDRLVGSPEFIDFWSNKWSDLLQVNPKFLGTPGADAFRDWVRQTVASNKPYNQFVHEILTADGSTVQNPPASYFKILDKPEDLMENTTHLFLGVRFNCNKCHDHPFERWTQRNYWELASYFAHVGTKSEEGKGDVVFDKAEGEVESPYPGGVQVSFPYKHPGKTGEQTTRRRTLASWLTSEKNPYFAKSFVNRLWSYFLGVGFIEPVDDIRAGNPASNPELLDRLTADFIKSGFDIRATMRLICKSRVYQQSIQTNEWNEDDSTNFSHAIARRLPAETLYDAIHVATGSLPSIPGKKRGLLAVEVSDPSVKIADGFLDLFGRPPRESACECERTSNVSLGQAISLVNGPTVANALNDGDNSIARLCEVETDGNKVLEELFLMFLGRMPSSKEQPTLVETLNIYSQATLDSLSAIDRKRFEDERAALVKMESDRLVVWQPFNLDIYKSNHGLTPTLKDDGSVLISGENKSEEDVTFTFVGWTDMENIRGIKLDVLTDDSLPNKGPGRYRDGNFQLIDFKVSAVSATNPTESKRVLFSKASADVQRAGSAVSRLLNDEDRGLGWAIFPQIGAPHELWMEATEPFGWKGGTVITITLNHNPKAAIGRLRFTLTNSPAPVQWYQLPPEMYTALATPPDQRTDAHRATFHNRFLNDRGDWRNLLRISAARDVSWALVNSPAFLFNR